VVDALYTCKIPQVLELQRNLCIEASLPIVSYQRAAYTFRKIFFHISKPKEQGTDKFKRDNALLRKFVVSF